MKNSIKLLGFIALVAVIGLSFAACEPEPVTTTSATGNLKIEILHSDGMRGTVLTAVYDGPEKIKSYEWECGWRGDDGWGEYQTRTGKGKDFKVSEGEEKRNFKVTVTFEGDYYPETSEFSFYNRETNKYTDIIDQVLPTGTLDGTWYKTCLVNDIKPTGIKVDVDALLIINGLDFIYYIFKPDFAAGTITDVSKIIALNSEDIYYVWKGGEIDLSHHMEGGSRVPDKYVINLFFSHRMDHYTEDWDDWGERIERISGVNSCMLELAKDGKSFTLAKPSWGGQLNEQLLGTWNFVNPASGNDTKFTVTFNSDGGSGVSAQTVTQGGKVSKPSDPTKALTLAAGLYKGSAGDASYTFDGWYNGATLWDFNTNTVTGNITLTAKWTEPANALVLIPYATVAANNIAAAVTYVNTPANVGTYTLLLGTDLSVAANQTLDKADVALTILGIGTERIIQFTGTETVLFTVYNATASLTLGNNITLKGRTEGVYGGLNLVSVRSGHLIMKAGSKITGHTTFTSQGAVWVEGPNAKFTMEGGEISGNKTTNIGDADFSPGGVSVYPDATFVMSGGTIRGNYNAYNTANNDNPADVCILDLPLTLSGNADIGALMLLGGPNFNSYVTLGGKYTGAVSALNLISNSINNWVGKTLITAVPGYTLTAADIARFTLGKFIIYDSPTDDRPISGNNLTTNPTWKNYTIAKPGNLGVLKEE